MMKAVDAVYKFGYLYVAKSRKKIVIEEGAEMVVTLEADAILESDPNFEVPKHLNASDKPHEVIDWRTGTI